MKTEIEKMYINAGIEKQTSYYCSFEYGAACPYDNMTCPECPYYKEEDEPQYPDFTAEKQLELIKWLAKRGYGDYTSSLLINITDDRVYFSAGAKPKYYVIEVLYDSNRCTDFENALANLINNLWQDLTNQEKEEIRRILK